MTFENKRVIIDYEKYQNSYLWPYPYVLPSFDDFALILDHDKRYKDIVFSVMDQKYRGIELHFPVLESPQQVSNFSGLNWNISGPTIKDFTIKEALITDRFLVLK
jgi:hypothetical protein